MSKTPASPTEPFKRALTATVRSLGEAPQLEVVYSGDGPKMVGGRLILPHPQRDMPAADVARLPAARAHSERPRSVGAVDI